MLLQAIIQSGVEQGLNEFYFATGGLGSELKPLDPFYTFNLGYNPVDGYHYFTMKSIGGAPQNRATKVYKYDASTMTLLQGYTIPVDTSYTETFDSHMHGQIAFDSSGHLYIVRERGEDSVDTGDGHDTDILLYKTTVAGDLSTLTLIKEISGYYAYPTIWIFGSTIYIGARGSTSTVVVDEWIIHKSTDGGSTFNSYSVVDTALGLEGRAYGMQIYNYDEDAIVITINNRKDSIGAFETVYVLKSTDGITWSNWQGTFTKNVNSSGAITQAELDTNCIVYDKPSDDYTVHYQGGYVKDGNIKILIARMDRISGSGNALESYESLFFYTYDSGWVSEDISEILNDYYEHIWAREPMFVLSTDLTNDYIYYTDVSDSTNPLREYKSSDGFNTYTTTLLENFNNEHFYGAHAFNASSSDETLLILVDVQGDYTNFNDYSNLRIIKP